MYYINMTKTLTVTKARENLTSLVEKADKRLDEFIITVNGVPAAVLISASEYESWKETMDILSDPGALKAIKRGEEDIKNGKFVTLEELKKELNV
ncbi:MAG: Prevent-host-death family protein [Candidatus Gottesmanbacteria bacterium GW2011_GWC2_39_8]|uniref:Antitoxin n=1 Tax=Candidatus Gottesmanbacteria bacterium GW2011_GWC2_39_8 TaxID=1618450 RepID=A0A0G0SDB2_9BACT|nr:MAG: Prevent-host-death family protein [Candidatus Gottesmanbacteria bacterium GW2011_GWC2_39_8]